MRPGPDEPGAAAAKARGPGDRVHRVVAFLLSHSRPVLLVATLLALVAGVRTGLTYAHLKSDLEELLPGTAPSVVALDRARERLTGLRHLGVVVDVGRPENADKALAFLSDLEQRVASYPPGVVALARSGVAVERQFFETFALQLAEPADVRALREAVEARRRWELTHAMGMSLLDAADDPPPAIPVQAFIDKYATNHSAGTHFPGDRFLSEDRRTAVLVIQTGPLVDGFEADSALLERLKKESQDLGFPKAYAPELRLGFAGDVATRVEETRGLVTDLGISGVAVLALVLLVIYGFYRSWAAWPVLLVPVVFGALYTFGLVALPPLGIRYLNSNTAFLSSIIIGNGINSGIVLLARLQEQLKAGDSIDAAIETAFRETYRATLAAALAAAAAYGSLTLTDFRGFKQFGWIGGLGMPVCWLATYALAPCLMRRWGAALRHQPGHGARFSARLSAFVTARPRWVLGAFGILAALAIVGMVRRESDWLETDFSRLRRADSFTTGERYWGKRMDETLHRYLTPTVVMTDSEEQAGQVERAVRDLAARGEAGGLIASVRSWDDVLPPTRLESLAEARKLAAALSPSMRDALPAERRALVERLLSPAALTPVTPEDVPSTLAAGLRDREGRFDRNVLVFPQVTSGTWDATRLAAFARDMRGVAHAVSREAMVTGPLMLSSDIIDAMRRDGPRATALALGITLLVALLAFRSLELSALAMGSLVLGVTLMLGAAAWVGQRLNFSNFVALPITFGVAADYSINVLQRGRSSSNSREAVANTGGAVALCSLTTVIGFGSLLVAQNRALFSFGALAVTGELTCLATAILAIPAYLALRPRLTRASREASVKVHAPGSAPRGFSQ